MKALRDHWRWPSRVLRSHARAQPVTCGYFASVAVHLVLFVTAHAMISNSTPHVWPSHAGMNSVAREGSVDLLVEFATEEADEGFTSPQLIATDELSAPDSLLEVEVTVRPARINRLPTTQSLVPEVSFSPLAIHMEPTWNVPSKSFVPGRGPEMPGHPPIRALEKQPPRPPKSASRAALETVFAAGELRKTTPRPRYNPAPIFPPELLATGQSGVVLLYLQIAADGRVAKCSVRRSSGLIPFDEAAVRAVRNWRFDPAERFGVPVATEVLYPIRFQFLDD